MIFCKVSLVFINISLKKTDNIFVENLKYFPKFISDFKKKKMTMKCDVSLVFISISLKKRDNIFGENSKYFLNLR